MATNPKLSALSVQVTGTGATSRSIVFTSSNGTTQIDQIKCRNNGASAITVYFYICPNSTTSGTVIAQDDVTVGAGDTEIVTKLLGDKIPQGYTLQCHEAGGTDAYVTVSSAEIR